MTNDLRSAVCDHATYESYGSLLSFCGKVALYDKIVWLCRPALVCAIPPSWSWAWILNSPFCSRSICIRSNMVNHHLSPSSPRWQQQWSTLRSFVSEYSMHACIACAACTLYVLVHTGSAFSICAGRDSSDRGNMHPPQEMAIVLKSSATVMAKEGWRHVWLG